MLDSAPFANPGFGFHNARVLSALIAWISSANPMWGSPRILGELRKIGIDVAKSAVEK